MPYTKTTWVNGGAPAINATNLNKIETGIQEAHAGFEGNASDLIAHKADEATETELGHVRLSDISITDPTTGEKYRWGVEGGRIFLEKVV